MLRLAIEKWDAGLTADATTELLTGLKGMASKVRRIGTGFTGCEITFQVLSALCDFWAEKYSVTIPIELAFCCELDDEKAAWLQHKHPNCGFIGRDVAELSRTRAWNRVTNGFDVVPPCDLWLGGFVCVDKSKLNRNRGAHADGIQTNSGSTGATFRYARDYLEENKPPAFVLENLKELKIEKVGHELSDLDFVLEELRNIGYTVSANVYQASDYGSLADRARTWIRGFLGDNQRKIQHCHSMMAMLKTPILPPTLYFGEEFEELDLINASLEEKGGCRVADPDWGDKHIEAFREAELPYPPKLSSLPSALQHALLPLEDRAREVVIFAEKTEPWPKTFRTPQFMDCNLSMQYLQGSTGNREFFSETCPTLSGNCKIWVRVQLSESERKWAFLPGWMLMRLIGYPGLPHDFENDKLMTSFAGNAFSGFSIGPVLMGFCSTIWNNRLQGS